jgi:hypothetical protein
MLNAYGRVLAGPEIERLIVRSQIGLSTGSSHSATWRNAEATYRITWEPLGPQHEASRFQLQLWKNFKPDIAEEAKSAPRLSSRHSPQFLAGGDGPQSNYKPPTALQRLLAVGGIFSGDPEMTRRYAKLLRSYLNRPQPTE